MIIDSLLVALLALGNVAAKPAEAAVEGAPAKTPVIVAQAQPRPVEPPNTPPVPAPKPKAEPPPKVTPKPPAQAAPKAESKAPQMDADVAALVERMQAFYEGTKDFTADFEQRYTYKAFKRTQVSTGRVAFSKPAVMRWDYEKPSKKTFVLAKDKVYAHDPDAMLLTVASIGTNQLSASVTFLWGQGRLADEFDIVKTACKDCQGTQLTMTPKKPDPRFKRIILEVDPKTAQVLKSTVIDPDGSENAITFKKLETNVGLQPDHFKLTPPEGTQIQDYTKTAAP